ncbi:MAG TPA: hypothetical protein VK709_12285 [Candidatus Saccharimonadales bacterium]|jgi:hypothetical protein|nr:hypothetical protein [Candidatus Saccharimonadales bacterium]
MGIFSRSAITIPSLSPDKSDCNVSTKTLSDSKKDLDSLAEFLSQRQLITTDDAYGIEGARERVENSGLDRMMLETCNLINKMGGRTIVDVHSFLPPIPILHCFIFQEDGTEYFMRLELQGATPTLIFAERHCRDTVTNDFVRWACRLVDIEPVQLNVKLVHEFQDVRVSVEQVREWFKYLVSGLNRSRKPSF